MNPLTSRLASLRRKVRLLEGWQGISAILTLLIGAVVLVGLLDWLVQLPSLVRGGLLVGILGSAGVVAFRYLFVPFRAPCDDLTLALRIEEEFPELNDALGSTVQFLAESPESPGMTSSSEAMRKKAVAVAVTKAEQFDFGRIVSYRGALLLGCSLLVVGAVAAHFAYRHTQFSGIALARLADPFGGHTWTSVDVPNAPDRIAKKQALTVKAVFKGIIPRQAKVEIVDLRAGAESQRPEERNLELAKDADTLVIPWDVKKYDRDFKFRVVANDGSFPRQPGRWHTIRVLEPPSLAPLSGQPSPQIDVVPPIYAELPSPQKLTPGTKMIRALAGSQVVFRAAVDRPIAKAWFEYRPANTLKRPPDEPPVPLFRSGMLVGQLAAGNVWTALGEHFGSQTVWDRVPAELEPDGLRFMVRFTAWVNGTCNLRIEDADGLPNDYPFELDVDVDPQPFIKLVRPTTELTLVPDAEVAFKFNAEDETYGLRSVYLEYKVQHGRDDLVGSPLQRANLKLPASYEKGLPQLSGVLATSDANATDPLALKPRRVDVTATWPLKNQFKIGDLVWVEVCGDDYCDVYGYRPPGRGVPQIVLRIVSKGELAKVVDDKLKQVQQDVKNVKELQEKAHDMIKEVEAKKDKITEKEIDKLVEAEATQKLIQEKIGDTDQGLRQDLNKLQDLLKDNKMKGSEAEMVAGMIKGALDQLARQELPQIEQSLAAARKQLQADANKDAKKDKGQDPKDPKNQDPKKKDDPLGKPEKLQNSALKNLDELSKALDPWTDMQAIKEQVRSVFEKQQQIKNELNADKNKLQDIAEQPGLTEPEKKELERPIRDDLNKQADAIKDLAQRAEELQKKLKTMEDARRKKDDKDNADKLKEAGKIGDKARLANEMRDIANELKKTAENQKADPTPSNQAQQKLQKNIENLENMMAALEGKDAAADKLRMDKNKQAQKKVDELARDMKVLKDKLDKAEKELKDDEEKLQSKRKEIAKEFDALQQKLEEQARELARLQEPRAAQDVVDAAKQAGDAAKKLGMGEDAGEQPKQAQDDIKDAKNELKQSEDELAREMLAKIADKIEGLKKREDEAIDRTKEFHKRLLTKKAWTDAFGRSLDADAKSQEGLARETRSLKEKIKEAKVFEHIMDKAAKSMDEAVEVMKDRRKVGIENRQHDFKAGKGFDEDEVADENDRQKETLAQQMQARQRLQRLLDAVKEELAKKPDDKKPDMPNEGGDDMPDMPKVRSGDGIPPMAELKALKGEQLDLNERTEEFHKQNPDTMKLNADQKARLEQLQQDQRALQQLFLDITAAPEKKGDAP